MNSNREHCILQLSTLLSSEKIVINIEKSIFNNAILYATKKNIEKNWSNKMFEK